MAIMRNPEDVDRQFAVYEAQFAALRTENAELRERLGEVEGLLSKSNDSCGDGRIAMIKLIAHFSKNWSEMTRNLWNQRYDKADEINKKINSFLSPTLPTNVPEPGNECCKKCKGTGKLNAVLHEGVEVIACPTCMGTGFKFGEGMTLTEAYAYHKAKRKNMVTVRREDLDAVMLAIKYDCLPSDAITNRLKAALAVKATEEGEPT